MKEKFIRFMQGRYGGADKLNSHLMYLLFILVAKFMKNVATRSLNLT